MTQASRPPVVAANEDGIRRAATILRDGGLVAVPTETVYGLAARADRDESVAAIYHAKGRPSFNPLIVHVPDVAAARRLATFDAHAERVASAFWPGPLTLVLPIRPDSGLAPAVTAGLASVALRCPLHPVMRAVLELCGVPLAAPSANRSGAVSPTCAQHVWDSLGDRVDLILDGGACETGVESTILALRESGAWQILRPGPITEAQLQAILGRDQDLQPTGSIEAPGQLASHYAPGKPVRLNAAVAEPDEFHIGFGSIAGDWQLSASDDLNEAAARLYSALHAGTHAAHARIAVAPIPEDGIGAAINDRLHRAAA